MTLEERVRRLERLAIGETTTATEEIRRDLAAESEVCEHGVRLGGKCARCCEDCPYGRDAACHCGHGSLDHNSVAGRKCCQPGCLCRRFRPAEPRDSDVAALRSQVADLTRERDEARKYGADHSTRAIRLESDRDAALARAEKAERERDEARKQADSLADWRCDVTVALGRPQGAFYADVPKLIREMVATLAARDATIAEARGAILGARLHGTVIDPCWCTWGKASVPEAQHGDNCSRILAWLAGQPAPRPLDSIGAGIVQEQRAEIEGLRAEVARLKESLHDEAWMHAACLTIAESESVERADEPTFLNSPAMDAVRNLVRKAARFEGLRARCEAWMTAWERRDYWPELGVRLLADLRAGRAGVNDLCTVCDWPHPADKPHRYRIPCPDGRIGCAVAHYGPVDPNAVRAARDAVIEAAVRYVETEEADASAWPGGPDDWMAANAAAWDALKDARDRLLALDPRRQG